MQSAKFDPANYAQSLIRCPSVTPHEGGALDYLGGVLSEAGFACHRLTFAEDDYCEIDNLFARIGTASPHLCFAGHTDVVPVGDEAAWTAPPFDGRITNDTLIGRGAVDMKGAIACFVAAALRHLDRQGDAFAGSISFLITGDEEADAVNGTVKVLDWMAANSHTPDHCLVGEPTNPGQIGDEIKIGRRGSLNAVLTVAGVQGHVAYPHLSNNPVSGMIAALTALTSVPLDDGNAHFPASNLEVTSIDTGNTATNVIPGGLTANFNVRFNDLHSQDSLRDLLRARIDAALEGLGLVADLQFSGNSEPFLTAPGPLVDVLSAAVTAKTDMEPILSTAGGTSDARFIKSFCPVLEFGLVNQTMHQVDERVPVSDLYTLTAIYEQFIENYFQTFNGQ